MRFFYPNATTLPETNIASENRVSQKGISLPTITCSGAMLVVGGVLDYLLILGSDLEPR